jgi:hypothetical protein
MKTREEVFIKALEKRCKYESSKKMDYDTHLAVMDAMEEWAEYYTSKSACDISDHLCSICAHNLTNFELNNNMCIKCGQSVY